MICASSRRWASCEVRRRWICFGALLDRVQSDDSTPLRVLSPSACILNDLSSMCSFSRLASTSRTRSEVVSLLRRTIRGSSDPGHLAPLLLPLLPHAIARMTSRPRSRSTNTASSALLRPQEEALYSEGKHRWGDEDDSSTSDGNDESDESSDGDEEEKPRRRRRREAQRIQQGSSVRPSSSQLSFPRS